MSDAGVAIGVAIASSEPARSGLAASGSARNSQGNHSLLSSPTTRSGGYVRSAHIARLRETLSEREWAVVRDVAGLRLVTGHHLERLHFAELGDRSRPVVRRRVLGRLVRARVLTTLERQIGGVRAGSSGLVYGLDIGGKRLLAADSRATRPSLPGERHVRHVLAVSQLYVDLVELVRADGFELDQFEAEPASWWLDGRGGRLKPDAHALVTSGDHSDHWWIEVDLATEHVPAIKRKLLAYLDFDNRGQLGPDGVMPLVVITVPDTKRCSEIDRLIHQLSSRAGELFTVALHNDAAEVIMGRLKQT